MTASTTTATSSPKDRNLNIRLRRLDSKISIANSTYSETSTLPPYKSSTSLSKPRDPFLSPTSSTTSSLRSPTLTSDTTHQNFIPTSTLRIESLGKKRCSLPLSSNELEIAILASENEIQTETGFASDVGADGIKYISIRPDRKSGSCFLVRGDDASQTPLASTTYFFGPGRNPKIWIGASPSPSSTSSSPHLPSTKDTADSRISPQRREETTTSTGTTFQMISKKLLSRTVRFEPATARGTFEWRYASKTERRTYSNPPPNNLLLLERVGSGNPTASSSTTSSPPQKKEAKSKAKQEKVLVARLVRGEDTRTRGSSSSSAGNGGVLEMCLVAGAGAAEGRERIIILDEVTVLVTCMVMLKKEIDRMRAVQMAVIAGAAGS